MKDRSKTQRINTVVLLELFPAKPALGPLLLSPETFWRISGDINLFGSSKRKHLGARNFAFILILIPGRSITNGFPGLKGFREFRETDPCSSRANNMVMCSLCLVAIFGHFQNALIFRILAVFSSRFLHRTTAKCCRNVFSMFLCIFTF